jgi:hypothetical protein
MQTVSSIARYVSSSLRDHLVTFAAKGRFPPGSAATASLTKRSRMTAVVGV